MNVETVLKNNFPVNFQNIPTVLTGYSDFIASFSRDLLLLDNPCLKDLKQTGIDQVAHTIFAYHKLKQVDLRQFFSAEISLDNDLYLPFKNSFDFSHPVKFWPSAQDISGGKP